MRVYFTGCHGSGKSTLARYVSEQYNLPIITEAARMILSEQELHVDTLRSNLDVVDKYQTQVFERQLVEERKYVDFVSDRCLLDAVAYAAQHSRILPTLIQSSQLKEYIEKIKDSSTCIFYVKPSPITFKSDGVREALNWEGAVAIDSKIHFLLEMYNLKYFQINSSSMQDRAKLIDCVLSMVK